jgi:hypothetical protein
MAAEFEDAYGHENIDIDVTVKEHNISGGIRKPYVSVVLTKVQTADDFVDAFTDEPREIEAFFAAVREAEVEYRRLTLSD